MDFKILTLFSVLVAAEVLQQSVVLARIRSQIRDVVPEEEFSEVCYNRQGEVGQCVQNYLCNRTTGTVIEDGSDVFDVRSQRSSTCIAPLVCCKPADNDNLVQVNSNVSIHKGLRHQRDVTVTPQGCGWRNENGVKDAPNGTLDGSAKPGEFPWMVTIMRREDRTTNNYSYVGSGFLINERVALTAAHAIALENAASLYLVVGNYDRSNILEKFLKKVNSFVLHEQYQADIYVNDIAMIITKKPVKWLPHVGYICLPPLNAPLTPGSRCFASGWGDNAEKVHQYVMGKAELPVMSRDACQTSLRTTELSPFFVLNECFMCAGGELGKDTCKGDGGSPLACPIEGKPGRYMATGLLSWGMSCGLDGLPSVYIDVARQRQWIDEKMTQHGLTTDSYTQY